jgi:hypothetical protein
MVVHIAGTPVHFAFLKAGEPLALRLEHGNVVPVVDAHVYIITDAQGSPVQVQTQDQLAQEINAAVGTRVYWEVQASQVPG